MYRSSNRELWLAFLTMGLVAALYFSIVIVFQEVPAASELFGHSLGILGFFLMILTETLYSLRKRSRLARWGRMANWLEFHIYTGLVGPFLVLLHTSWKFNGLAGAVTLMMILVVLSGFFGRYIYTAVPRTADGVEVAASELAREINRAQAEVEAWLVEQPPDVRAIAKKLQVSDAVGSSFIFGRVFRDIADLVRWLLAAWSMKPDLRQRAWRLQVMAMERRRLRGQLASLAAARKLMGIWHAVHIPIGMALFTAACVHIGGAVYYATLLR